MYDRVPLAGFYPLQVERKRFLVVSDPEIPFSVGERPVALGNTAKSKGKEREKQIK
jgi:hypothetical protein